MDVSVLFIHVVKTTLNIFQYNLKKHYCLSHFGGFVKFPFTNGSKCKHAHTPFSNSQKLLAVTEEKTEFTTSTAANKDTTFYRTTQVFDFSHKLNVLTFSEQLYPKRKSSWLSSWTASLHSEDMANGTTFLCKKPNKITRQLLLKKKKIDFLLGLPLPNQDKCLIRSLEAEEEKALVSFT